MTAVFGVYALAVLGSLLVVGSLSDHVGRRPVLLAALALQGLAMLAFLAADGVAGLVTARVIQGLSTGAALGALGATLLDLDRDRGAVANAVGAMAGTASGALVAGVFVAYLPAPTRLVYAVIAILLVAQAVGVAFMAETSSPRPGALRSLRPQLGVPERAGWRCCSSSRPSSPSGRSRASTGSLGPAVVQTLVGRTSPVIGGLALFVLAGAASVTVLLSRYAGPERLMAWGIAALVAGVVVTETSLTTSSATLFFLGAAVAGAGFGGAFQGALRMVVPLARPHERAGLLSAVFVAELRRPRCSGHGGRRVRHSRRADRDGARLHRRRDRTRPGVPARDGSPSGGRATACGRRPARTALRDLPGMT